MQVKVENLEGLKRLFTVQLPREQYELKLKEQLAKIKANGKFDGFRPGKVPESMIKQRYGKALEQDVLNELIQESLPKALEEAALNPASAPEYDSSSLLEGQPVEYKVKFEVIPSIVVKDLAGVAIKKYVAKVDEENIGSTLDNLRKQRTTWEPAERASINGDQLIIDFEGTVGGEPFKGNTAQGFTLILGEGRMIAGFEEGLLGVSVGQDTVLKVTFPEKYHAEELAGKPAEFKVNVKEVNKPVLPELNDAFAEEWDIKEGGLEALKKEIQIGLERESHNLARSILRNTVFDKLLELNTFDLPNSLIDAEIERMQQHSMREMQRRYGVKEIPAGPREYFEAAARRSVALALLIAEIIKLYKLKPDPEKVGEIVRMQATAYEHPEEIIKYMLSNKDFLQSIEGQALEEQVIDKMLETALVEEVETSYAELAEQHAQTAEHDDDEHDHENCDHDHHHH